MTSPYDVGDVVRVTGTFTDISGDAVDPSTITLKVTDPSGNSDTYTYALSQVTKSATGIYYKDVSIDEAGDWWCRWEGTGTAQAADEDMFWVQESRF